MLDCLQALVDAGEIGFLPRADPRVGVVPVVAADPGVGQRLPHGRVAGRELWRDAALFPIGLELTEEGEIAVRVEVSSTVAWLPLRMTAEKQGSGSAAATSNQRSNRFASPAASSPFAVNFRLASAAGAGRVSKVNEVAIPKFPLPPPRQAHSSSGSSRESRTSPLPSTSRTATR